MMVKQEEYQAELDEIIRATGKRVLSQADVVAYTGRSRDYVREHLGITGNGITATRLARKLCAL